MKLIYCIVKKIRETKQNNRKKEMKMSMFLVCSLCGSHFPFLSPVTERRVGLSLGISTVMLYMRPFLHLFSARFGERGASSFC